MLVGVVQGDGVSTFALRGRKDVTHIPTHFYVLAYTPEIEDQAIALIFPNMPPTRGAKDIKVKDGLIPAGTLQTITGLEFFPDMPETQRAQIMDSNVDTDLWRVTFPQRFQCRAGARLGDDE